MKLKKFKFKSVNSTNDIAIKIIKTSKIKSGMIIAETQKNGRGQYGKKWISYKGNLFTTIFFSLDKINLTIKQLTIINCFLVKKLLSYYYKKKL
jgi:BirA family biotin operon repressor/biotin-[acetyl-CoA-carboxylase] ligase